MKKTVRFAVSLDHHLLDDLDRVLVGKKYETRSEAIRDLIRDHLVAQDWDQKSQTVGTITSSPAWQADAVLFITWDEDSGRGDNRVLTLVLRPDVKHRVSAVSYDHYSLLATIEDILGVPRLANAATATPMRDLIG